MKTVVSAALFAALLASQATYASAAPKHRDASKQAQSSDCVVTGWTDWSITRPIFKCPDQEVPAKHRAKSGE